MYVGILLVHVLCAFFYWMNKGLFHLFLYLPLVGMWLFLAVSSSFVDSWSWTWTNCKFHLCLQHDGAWIPRLWHPVPRSQSRVVRQRRMSPPCVNLSVLLSLSFVLPDVVCFASDRTVTQVLGLCVRGTAGSRTG